MSTIAAPAGIGTHPDPAPVPGVRFVTNYLRRQYTLVVDVNGVTDVAVGVVTQHVDGTWSGRTYAAVDVTHRDAEHVTLDEALAAVWAATPAEFCELAALRDARARKRAHRMPSTRQLETEARAEDYRAGLRYAARSGGARRPGR